MKYTIFIFFVIKVQNDLQDVFVKITFFLMVSLLKINLKPCNLNAFSKDT